MKKHLIIAWLSIFSVATLSAQTLQFPNYALKSHETLVITSIDVTPNSATVYLTVENRREGGSFCADKNIFIVYPDGTRSKIISSKGIPVCPASHKFKAIGEKLSFELVFPALKPGIRCADLIEDCNDNCFSFYGLCLDNNLNRKVDEAFALVESGEQAKALASFKNIAESDDFKGSGIEGLIYLNIIELASQTGKSVEAAGYYNKLKAISIPHSEAYVKHLNSEGILF